MMANKHELAPIVMGDNFEVFAVISMVELMILTTAFL